MGKEHKNKFLKQQYLIFIEEYLKNREVGECYAIAYKKNYKDKVERDKCQKSGARLLKNDEIQREIKKRQEEIKNENIASIQEVQEKLTEILRISIDPANPNPKLMEALIKGIDVFNKMQGVYEKRNNNDVNISVKINGIETEEFKP